MELEQYVKHVAVNQKKEGGRSVQKDQKKRPDEKLPHGDGKRQGEVSTSQGGVVPPQQQTAGSPRTTDKRVYSIKHRSVSVKFECDSRYTPLESIGTGAYGVVCAAKDNRTGRKVAIKKIPRAFDDLTIAKRTYRELKILRHLRHDNIISILDVMEPPDNESTLHDVYVVLDLMESDLHHIIHSVQPLSDEHIKYFLYQIVRGLKYIHSANVIHRDLKPSNLLINRNCELKIGDFGMARGLSTTPEDRATFLTEYVATRWYRAPELMLSFSEYTVSLDMWSMGCIFAEMLGRRQLFPGKNYVNQLQLVLSVVGTPSQEYIQHIGSDKVKMYLKTLPERSPVELFVLFPNASKEALHLLERFLQLDPRKRCTAEEALMHPYLSMYHDVSDEPICRPPFDFSFEKDLTTKESLKTALLEEVKEYHKCRLPIPPTNLVRDALKKMMEEREKSTEGDSIERDKRDQKEVVKKKRPEDKKRKHPDGNPTAAEKVKKKSKVYSPLTDNDKNVLEHWNKIQLAAFNNPARRLASKGGVDDQHKQELIIRQQNEQLDKQQKQILEQQRRIQQQAEQIKLLVHQQKILIRECKASGIKIPLSTPNPSPLTTPPILTTTTPPQLSTAGAGSTQAPPVSKEQKDHFPPPLPPLSQQSTVPRQHNPSQQQLQKHVLPSQQSKLEPQRESTVIPVVNCSIPPPPLPPPPPPPTHSLANHSMTYSVPPPPPPTQQQQQQTSLSMDLSPTSLQQVTYQVAPPYAPPTDANYPMPLMPTMSTEYIPPYGGILPPSMGAPSNPYLAPSADFFSPLTSKELMELTSQEVRKLSPYAPQSVGSFVPPLPEDFDNFFNLPTGCGAGYGVGVSDDDLQVSIPDSVDNDGPPSANFLQEWLQDIDDLDAQGLEALQHEMEFGSTDNFFRDLDKL